MYQLTEASASADSSPVVCCGPDLTEETTRPDSLNDLRNELPANATEASYLLAARSMLITTACCAVAGVVAWLSWSHAWYWLMPVSWWLSGFAITALFLLGHDCGHHSFVPSKAVCNALGHFFFISTLYPYYAWRYSHNAHHAHTNSMKDDPGGIYHDNAWKPYSQAKYQGVLKQSRLWAAMMVLFRMSLPFASSAHLFVLHFRPGLYRPAHRTDVRVSIVFLALTVIPVGVALWMLGGIWALLHFWVLPWICFQCWMATYTFLHHTSTESTFLPEDQWTPVEGQFHNTINVLFPRVISWLHHNIDIHVIHHIAPGVPSYRLRAANSALRTSQYGPLLREEPFSVPYLYRQLTRCHVVDDRSGKFVPAKDWKDAAEEVSAAAVETP